MKPHFWYWTLAFFNVLFSGLVSWFTKENALDVAVHDTYLVIDQFHIFLFFSMWLFFLGVQLWLIDRQRKKIPKWLWTVNAFVAVLPPWMLFIISKTVHSDVHQLSSYSVVNDVQMQTIQWEWINVLLPVVFIIYLLFQVLFTFVFIVRLRHSVR